MRLNGLENPDTRARLFVNGDVIEVKDGEKFLENKCQVKKINKQGLVENVRVTCIEDERRSTFDLSISPRVQLEINGEVGEYGIGDFLYQTGDSERYVYIGYMGSDGSTFKENLYLRLMAIRDKKIEGLSQGEIESVAILDRNLRDSDLEGGIISDVRDVAGRGVALVRLVTRFLFEGKRFAKVSYSEGAEDVFVDSLKKKI